MIVMEFEWQGVTPEQYDEVKRLVNWEENPHPGGAMHIAWFENGALRCVDVWESEESFNQFTEQRLVPAFQKAKIEGRPEISFRPAYDTFVLPRSPALA